MRPVCLGCELENNKPKLCSFSRAKMKKLCTTKNEKAHDSLHFPGSAPGWLPITEVVKEVQQFSSRKQFWTHVTTQAPSSISPICLPESAPQQIPSPARFPISKCLRSQHTAQNVTIRKCPEPPGMKQEANHLSKKPTPMFAFGTSIPALKRHENPGHSSVLSLKDESSPSILSLAETTVGGLQGWKNLGSLRCNLHHVWAASV